MSPEPPERGETPDRIAEIRATLQKGWMCSPSDMAYFLAGYDALQQEIATLKADREAHAAQIHRLTEALKKAKAFVYGNNILDAPRQGEQDASCLKQTSHSLASNTVSGTTPSTGA